MDNKNFEIIEVWTATKLYLIIGIIGLLLSFLSEYFIIYQIIISKSIEVLILMFFFQILTLPFVFLTFQIMSWIKRTKFNIYYCDLNDDTDIDYIVEHCYIKDINEDGIIFIEKEDEEKYTIWNLFQKINL